MFHKKEKGRSKIQNPKVSNIKSNSKKQTMVTFGFGFDLTLEI